MMAKRRIALLAAILSCAGVAPAKQAKRPIFSKGDREEP